MTKAQWKAIYDYCKEFDCTRQELLAELKANGTLDRSATLEDLGECTNGTSYDAMLKFLEENI